MKKIFVLLLSILLLSGCSDNELKNTVNLETSDGEKLVIEHVETLKILSRLKTVLQADLQQSWLFNFQYYSLAVLFSIAIDFKYTYFFLITLPLNLGQML